MSYHPPTGSLPQIIVGEREEHRLTTLATSAMLADLDMRILCMSHQVADAVPDGMGRITVAATPGEDSLLALL